MDIIKQKQPRRAAGCVVVRPFCHKSKVRRGADAGPGQTTRMSPWEHMASISTKVDAARANWKGLIYIQSECGVFDPTPRLVKRAN